MSMVRIVWLLIAALVAGGGVAAWTQATGGEPAPEVLSTSGTVDAAAPRATVRPDADGVGEGDVGVGAPAIAGGGTPERDDGSAETDPGESPRQSLASAGDPSAPDDEVRGDDGPDRMVPGRGTERDPYRLTWPYLISASETYDPEKGRTELPPHITMLGGSVVEITGYFAAPLGTDETDELLVMLNRWDGCCIGLPPTPFDAIEVKLTEPVRMAGEHLIRYGTVTGRLEVDPFLIGDFLVGLYRMQDADVEWGG